MFRILVLITDRKRKYFWNDRFFGLHHFMPKLEKQLSWNSNDREFFSAPYHTKCNVSVKLSLNECSVVFL